MSESSPTPAPDAIVEALERHASARRKQDPWDWVSKLGPILISLLLAAIVYGRLETTVENNTQAIRQNTRAMEKLVGREAYVEKQRAQDDRMSRMRDEIEAMKASDP